MVIAFNRPALANVNLNAGSSSSFSNSCEVPERSQPRFLRIVACSSYIMQVRGSLKRPRCSVFCDDVANMGRFHNISTTPRERFDGSIARLPPGLDEFDRITENTCQLDDYLISVAAFVLSKLAKKVRIVSTDSRFTASEVIIPELVYLFVCVIAPCALSRQLVCAHPIYQADLADIRDAIPSVYPHPQYDGPTILQYKNAELALERARNAQYSRFANAPDWWIFEQGQRKLAENCGKALRGGRKPQANAESYASRGSAGSNLFDRHERPNPQIPRSRFIDPFGGAPGLEETHQGHRQKLAAMLQELRRSSRGETHHCHSALACEVATQNSTCGHSTIPECDAHTRTRCECHRLLISGPRTTMLCPGVL